MAEALEVAPNPAATLVRLEDMEPREAAALRAALDAAIGQEKPR